MTFGGVELGLCGFQLGQDHPTTVSKPVSPNLKALVPYSWQAQILDVLPRQCAFRYLRRLLLVEQHLLLLRSHPGRLIVSRRRRLNACQISVLVLRILYILWVGSGTLAASSSGRLARAVGAGIFVELREDLFQFRIKGRASVIVVCGGTQTVLLG